jgi:hypothetical protein
MAEENPNLTLEKRLLNKRKYMERIKNPRIQVLDDIICFCIPELEKMDINNVGSKGGHDPGKRYNGYAIRAVDLFASGWFGYSISPALDWIRVIDSDPELMLNEEVNLWLDFIENRWYTILENSNFYEIEGLKLRYAPTMGFCSSYMEEDLAGKNYVFKINHPGRVLLMEDRWGRASTTLVIEKIMVGEAIERFGEKSLSQGLINQAKADEYQEWEFCQLVEPNPDRDDRSILNTRFPYRSIWWQSQAGGPDGRDGIKIVRQSGYTYNPFTNWRMRKGTTPYGYGLAEAALVDIAQSNVMSKDLLMASNRAVDPPYNVPIEMQGMVDIRPHGFNYFQESGRTLSPVVSGVNDPIGAEERGEAKESIDRIFHVDFFTLLASMQGKSLTATQVIELAGEKAAVISEPVMKYNYENLEQIFKNLYHLERRAGRIPPPPAVYGNREPIVDFIGPLAQAQRKLFQGRGIQAAIEQSAPIWNINPDSMDKVDFDTVQDYILTTNNFPAKAIRTDEDVEIIRDNKAKMAQQQLQEQSMMNQSKMAVDMAKADKYSGGKVSEEMEAQG